MDQRAARRECISHHNACDCREEMFAKIQEKLADAERKLAQMREALSESVKLQSHYASILNDYDGGERLLFDSAQAWVDRLAALAQGEKP